MKNLRLVSKFGLLLLLLVAVGCRKDVIDDGQLARSYSADVPIAWYKLMEQIDRYSPGYRPPAASRMMGYIGLAGYEAAVHGMPGNRSLGSHYPGLFLPQPESGKAYHWPTAVNAAYHYVVTQAYPHIPGGDKNRIYDLNQMLEDELLKDSDSEVFLRSKSFGEAIGKAIFNWSRNDFMGHEAYLDPFPNTYQPPAGPGLWQPTWPDYTPALFPFWGQVRTFALNRDEIIARPPLVWSESPASPFYKQARETYEWTNKVRNGQDAEGLWMAEFWSDDFEGVTFTPSTRLIAIATQIMKQEGVTLDKAVEIYAHMGMALADAAISVWNSKYTYNLERPISYIRRVMDPNWETVLNHPYQAATSLTPPFPAYPSGHSGFAGAGGGILAYFFGNDYPFTDRCHESRTEFRGSPRSFQTFTQLAEEDAYSRIPLGVHFRMDCDEGIRLGYLAAQRVRQLPWR